MDITPFVVVGVSVVLALVGFFERDFFLSNAYLILSGFVLSLMMLTPEPLFYLGYVGFFMIFTFFVITIINLFPILMEAFR